MKRAKPKQKISGQINSERFELDGRFSSEGGTYGSVTMTPSFSNLAGKLAPNEYSVQESA